MRRANGAGSVYKLSGNRRKPWVAQITLGYEHGKRLYKIVGYYETKAKAEQAISLDAVMPASENASMTLKQLWEEWKTTRAYTDLSKQQQYCYKAAYGYMSQYYNIKYADLRLRQFQNMVDRAHVAGKGASTMKKIKTLAGVLSHYAKSQDIIRKVYSDEVRIPKTVKPKIEIFSETEIKLLSNNDAEPLIDTILIMIYTGMRITELLTLTKFNVDLQNMLIVGGIKTEAGKDRIIPIHPKIQKYVTNRYNSAENYLIEYDKAVGNKKAGTYRTERRRYPYQNYKDAYYLALERIGIRRITPHKARHTFATMLSASCKDRKAMALILGHTDPGFTEMVYDHPDRDRLKKAISAIDGFKHVSNTRKNTNE